MVESVDKAGYSQRRGERSIVKIAPVERGKNEGLGGVAVLYAAKASLGDALLGARTGSLVLCTCQVYN